MTIATTYPKGTASVTSRPASRAPRQNRRQQGAPTIADVAREAGCSPMTVSRVINSDGNVRDATRDAVRAAIAKLNYSPNSAARSLAGASQVRLGLLYSNPSAAYLSELLVGSLDQAARSDVQLVVEKCEFGGNEDAVARRLITNGIDGFLLPPPLCDEQPLLDMLREMGVPTVAVGPGKPTPGNSAVCIDDYRAARDMTRHLISLGHERIGFIVGNPHQSASAQRLLGFQHEMASAGLVPQADLIVQGLFSYRSGLDAATRLLDNPDPPTAIFASNDDMAAATVAVAHRRHLDVPADLSVCGYDNTSIATTIWPELTTIHQPIADMSRAAIELLVSEVRSVRNKQPAEATHVMLDYSMVRRHSDAAPALARARQVRKKGGSHP